MLKAKQKPKVSKKRIELDDKYIKIAEARIKPYLEQENLNNYNSKKPSGSLKEWNQRNLNLKKERFGMEMNK